MRYIYMKKIYLFSTLVAGLFAFSSCNNEPDFPGLDEKSELTNVAKYVTSYAGAVFSEDNPAKNTLPEWLDARYKTADKGSTAMVDYRFTLSIPEYVQEISNTKLYTLSADDYKEAWGEDSSLNYFSPSKPAANFLATILGKSIENPAEGNIFAVNYNEAQEDGSSPVFSEDFESKTLDAWENIKTTGSFVWKTATYNNNTYAQQSAYKHTDGELESYLISKEPSTIKSGLVLAFDALLCNYKTEGGRVNVLISSNLNGFTVEDITAATWDDITSNFTFATSPNNSGDIVPVENYALDAYNGKKIHIAFQYVGDGKNDATTTVRLDNIAIKEAAQKPVVYTAKTALYKYNGTAWEAMKDVDILQPADYTAIGVDYFTAASAQAYMPSFLAYKYPLVATNTVKAIAFKLSDTSYMAAEFQKTITHWESTAGTTDLTDEYEFDGSKWVYVRTVPKAALNEGFEGRQYIEKEPTIIQDWLNVMVKGEDSWRDRMFSKNIYTEATAYASKSEGEMEVWLITPILEVKSNYILTFDMVSGHWTHDALQVYVSSSFSGKEEDLAKSIEDNQWTEVTSAFDLPHKEGGYSPFTNVGKASLDAYVGQSVYIAFKYWGDKTIGKTSTIQLDNIYVGE